MRPSNLSATAHPGLLELWDALWGPGHRSAPMAHLPGNSATPSCSRRPGSCLPFPFSDCVYSHVPGIVLEAQGASVTTKEQKFPLSQCTSESDALYPLARDFCLSKPSAHCPFYGRFRIRPPSPTTLSQRDVISLASAALRAHALGHLLGCGPLDRPALLWSGHCLWSGQLWSALSQQGTWAWKVLGVQHTLRSLLGAAGTVCVVRGTGTVLPPAAPRAGVRGVCAQLNPPTN